MARQHHQSQRIGDGKSAAVGGCVPLPQVWAAGIALVESVNPQWQDLSVEKTDKSRLAARDPSASVGMTEKRAGMTNRQTGGEQRAMIPKK